MEQCYEEAVSKYPNHPAAVGAYRQLGYINYGKGDWGNCAGYFEVYASLSGREKAIRELGCYLGKAYERSGQVQEATSTYEAFLQATSSNDPRRADIIDGLSALRAEQE